MHFDCPLTKQTRTYVDEFLGIITYKYPHGECPIHGNSGFSYGECKVRSKAEKKTITKLLLKNRHPKNHEYLSVEEVAKLTKLKVINKFVLRSILNRNPKNHIQLSVEEVAKLKKWRQKSLAKGSLWLYSMKYKGKRIYLKESVDKHLRTQHHGWVKLVDYKTEDDDWIRRVLLHPNYDVDVLFYDGTYRRKNVLSYIKDDEFLKDFLIEEKNFMNPKYVSAYDICYGNEEYIDNKFLYSGEPIPPFEGGIERREW